MAYLDWSLFDSFYLFNPFYENLEPTSRIDQLVHLGEAHFDQYVKTVEDKLSHLKPGSRVVTYHGFGGSFPSSFHRVLKEYHHDDYLELWINSLNHSKILLTAPRH
ncbi:MAG: hypothetical protein HYR96_09565 [Deltaproteobacteria bacterium]|nr:hypothetical protein [Deltaproteobacteria bacterium]